MKKTYDPNGRSSTIRRNQYFWLPRLKGLSATILLKIKHKYKSHLLQCFGNLTNWLIADIDGA